MVQTPFRSQAERMGLYGLLVLLSVLFVMPLYWLVANSLQLAGSSMAFWPKGLHWENYTFAVTFIDYWKYARNSLIITSISVAIPTFTSALVGFGFARLRGPGKNALFMLMLSTMMLPEIVTQIPTYVIFFEIGLLHTFWPWVFWAIGGSAISIFLYRQFFSSIPKDLEEAARIDGCSTFRIFWSIFLPVSLPVVATVSILLFNRAWGNDYVTPFMFLRLDQYPLSTAIFSIGYTSPSGQSIPIIQSAGVVLFVLPIIAVFMAGQRYVVEGIVYSSIKG
ncbi:carbohydrate ABC transporter permease [Paenibacillus whitsoniae]|uniref:Carbohydrate ABC transporter permease n=1 Tax=Paenibacillus whitsoniae TaxID=2496558 RepID=A0A3S0C7J1_9BACL|nr:carbohydrate ABC transporter permease [Paenibacillus whitsoniae]RTE07828.1 carbohydrate ABC transporter permease [Paenibacillus whitsoniae]